MGKDLEKERIKVALEKMTNFINRQKIVAFFFTSQENNQIKARKVSIYDIKGQTVLLRKALLHFSSPLLS